MHPNSVMKRNWISSSMLAQKVKSDQLLPMETITLETKGCRKTLCARIPNNEGFFAQYNYVMHQPYVHTIQCWYEISYI